MESLDDANEMACPMVLQAVCGDLQLLLSLPFTPSTYHVVLARAVEHMANNKVIAAERKPEFHSLLPLNVLAKPLGNESTRSLSLEKPEPRKGRRGAARKRLPTIRMVVCALSRPIVNVRS
jgi:hypothetical protein